ncbi:unnamed protein product, partial [Porites evermanni]
IPFYISGLIGNVLVIRIVHKTREMHTPTNYLLASMAVSDVFTIMMFAAYRFVLSQHILDEKNGNLVCKAAVLITTFAIVSAITLTVLAVERYNALLKPLRTGLRLNKDNVKKAIALLWASGLITTFITIFAIVSSATLTVLAVERYNVSLKPLRTGLQLSEDNIKKGRRSHLGDKCFCI